MIDEHLMDDAERRILELQRQRDAYRRALVALQHCGSLDDVHQIATGVLEQLPTAETDTEAVVTTAIRFVQQAPHIPAGGAFLSNGYQQLLEAVRKLLRQELAR